MAEFLMIDPTKFAENNKQKSLAPHQRSNKISKKELDANNRFFFFFFFLWPDSRSKKSIKRNGKNQLKGESTKS
jgi:hypothetical protein